MKKEILLIGGTGVLSSAVTKQALQGGFAVTMINRGNNPIPPGAELIRSDKNNFQYIEKALEGRVFDAVIDFLCYTDDETEKSISFYSKYTKQYFYISSCAVYNTEILQGQKAYEESEKVLKIWPYSVSKWASEQKVQKLAEKYNIKYTIIRPAVTYGDTRIPYGIYPPYGYHGTFIARILNGKPIIRWNGGVNRCNMMRVEDFSVGVVGLIGNDKAYDEAFNICGDETPSWNDVLDAMQDALQRKITVVDVTSDFYANEIPDRKGELLGGRSIDAIISNEKIKKVVPEFKQNISLKAGVRRTIEAYLDNHYQKGIDWDFDAETDRIIKKWCKQNKINYKHYHLGYIDYLGTGTWHERKKYNDSYNKDTLRQKLFNKACRIIGQFKEFINP